MKKTMHFTYDPLALVRIVLQRYVEEFVQGKQYKAKQFACYEFLRVMADEALEALVTEYAEKHSLQEITLADWRADARAMFEIIFEKEDYKKLENDYKRRGYGATGQGVFDRSENMFYDCGFTYHWTTIRKIIEQRYPSYQDALDVMYHNDEVAEHNGVSREELDNFIVDNFELVGATKPIYEYL
ncbi:hypothetical protein [Paenibacillus alvei]|uniref:hypothetical protein n=1 Tax=Paenibacillus alvei TaxID=44250 RepID=UPI00228329C4|nr:hypothetical protein [Paenibacillus alvei]MCY7486387.1 hypothetical protein [Paenibacillus alvei]